MTFTLGPALLFCPADRPDRFEKALDRADAVVLDLEDGVAPDAKPAARAALAAHPLDPARVVVRINPAGTEDFAADLAAVAEAGYRTVMVAKADASLPPLPEFAVVALCETAAGVLDAPDLARRAEVVALMWGAEDLVASLGGSSSRDPAGRYRDVVRQARASVLLAAGAAGVAAIDAVHLAIDDLVGLRAEAEDAVASGFAATACIHPSHVPVIRDAYRPSAEEVAHARRVLDAPGLARRAEVVALMWGAEDLVASLGGSSSRDAAGRYRDVVRQARASVLLAAGAAGIAAIDAVHLAIDDLDGLRAEAEDAVASGFAATACIHPSHVPVIRDAYRPSAEEVAHARRVLEAGAGRGGVFRLDGLMVDGPVLRHAEAVLRRSRS